MASALATCTRKITNHMPPRLLHSTLRCAHHVYIGRTAVYAAFPWSGRPRRAFFITFFRSAAVRILKFGCWTLSIGTRRNISQSTLTSSVSMVLKAVAWKIYMSVTRLLPFEDRKPMYRQAIHFQPESAPRPSPPPASKSSMNQTLCGATEHLRPHCRLSHLQNCVVLRLNALIFTRYSVVPRTGHETEVSGLEYVNSSSRRMEPPARCSDRTTGTFMAPQRPSRFPWRV